MIEDILGSLDKVKRLAGGKYQACCPVHGDKNPSMSLTEKDGRVLIHCFACGAKGIDVVKELGLPASVLFEKPLNSSQVTDYQRKKLLQDQEFSTMFVNIYEAAESRGDYISLDDKRKYKMHVNRLAGIEAKLR